MIKKVTSGVYFLIRNNVIVYVGESANVFMRIGQHIAEGTKQFDSFTFYETNDRKRLESFLISILSPTYNIAPGKMGYVIDDLFTEEEIEFAINAYEQKNRLVSVRYAAEMCDEQPVCILHLIMDKRIHGCKIGGAWHIEKKWIEHMDEFKRMINENETQRIEAAFRNKAVCADG